MPLPQAWRGAPSRTTEKGASTRSASPHNAWPPLPRLGAGRIVLTARAENYLHSRADLADTIAGYRPTAGPERDVLYAPGIVEPEEIRVLVGELERPVNVLLLPDGPGLNDLASYQVSRVSIGGSFTFAAFGVLARGTGAARTRAIRLLGPCR